MEAIWNKLEFFDRHVKEVIDADLNSMWDEYVAQQRRENGKLSEL